MSRLQHQYIQDISRRSVLRRASQGMALGASAGLMPALLGQTAHAKGTVQPASQPSAQTPKQLLSKGQAVNAGDPLWGMAMSYGEKRLDLIDLDKSQILHSFTGFEASHAIIPVEHLNRFVVHGYRPKTRTGALMVLEVNPVTKSWSVLMDKDIKGGRLLHWQPRPDMSEIVFNTVGDGGLHVLDTQSLEIERYVGGGGHSNMAMMDNLLIATDEMSGPSRLLVTDRKTNTTLSTTSVNEWGHGVSVNFERGEAYVWAKDGIHRVSLAQKTMGKHLGVIPSLETGERCWFCWTPQGAQFSHDVAWNWDQNLGDVYNPYLIAVDMKNARLERISTGDKDIQPSFLQVSPNAKWGLASLRGRDEVGIFDLEANTFEGTVTAGPTRPSFFERDMAFCKDRNYALVTNTGDKSISLLNLTKREEVRRIHLPRKPSWFKSLSA